LDEAFYKMTWQLSLVYTDHSPRLVPEPPAVAWPDSHDYGSHRL
jgi:hypothetical protein